MPWHQAVWFVLIWTCPPKNHDGRGLRWLSAIGDRLHPSLYLHIYLFASVFACGRTLADTLLSFFSRNRCGWMTEHKAPLCTTTSWLHHCILLSTPFDWQLNLMLHKQYQWIVCPWMALSIHFAACFWLSVSLPGPAKPFITFSNTLIFLMLCGSIDALSGTHLTWKLLTPGCLYALEYFLRRIMTVYVVYHVCSPS